MSRPSLQVPASGSPSSQPEIIQIPRSNRRYQLPETGLDLPTELTLPQATVSRQTLIDFGNALGFAMPTSLNRHEMIERMRQLLDSIGYRTVDGTTFTRGRPVHLEYIGAAEAPVRGPYRDIQLPEIVPFTIFETRESMVDFVRAQNLNDQIRTSSGRLRRDLARDIREFLTKQGYAIDPRGNFVRRGGVTITGGYEFIDLVTPEVYVEFLGTPGAVPVTQEDLVRLNVPFNSIVDSLPRRRWPDFEAFVQDFSAALGVNPALATTVALLGRLSREPNNVLTAILQGLGSTRRYTRVGERLNAIHSFFRAKLQLTPRAYPRREQFHGNALTTMSFMEALNGGYTFGVDQYREEIDDLLNQNAVPPSHRKFLVEMIQNHPEIFPVMRLYNSNGTSLATSLIHLYYPEAPSEVQTLYAFAVNYPLIFPESDEKKARRQQLNKLSRPYIQSLYGIYETNDLEIILDTPQHPLELYLIAISKLEPEQLPSLVANFGMIVPEHLLTREIRSYVLLWMPQYRQIITRVPPIPSLSEAIPQQPESVQTLIDELAIYTDQEIITYFGYTGGFDTRNALIENVFRTISETGFMVYKEIDTDRATNTETVMLTEIRDLMRPYLVFGTPFSYRIHELDEFIQAWRNSEGFPRIDGEGNYTIAQVSRLQSLLPLMRTMNSQHGTKVEQILELIREKILGTMRRSAEVDEFIRDLRQASPRVRELLREIFFKIFYAGMYMRRWRGPGNRYPLQSAQTRGGSSPDPKVSLTLGQLYELMNLLRTGDEGIYNDLMRLPEISYNTRADDLVIRRNRLFETIRTVYRGELCIRQASQGLVISGHYYLAVCFREVIPDFSPYDVEAIS